MNGTSSISTREAEVLQLVASEYTTKEIANTLAISDHTVVTHRKNLMQKLGARNAAGLVRRGFESRILRMVCLLMIAFLFECSLNLHQLTAQSELEVIGQGNDVSMYLGTGNSNGQSEIILGENLSGSIFMKLGYDGTTSGGNNFFIQGLGPGDRYVTIQRDNGLATFTEDVKLDKIKGSATSPLYIDNQGLLVNSETVDKYWSVSGHGFSSHQDYIQNFSEGSVRGASGGSAVLYAAVHLPHGAIMQEVCTRIWDQSTSENISVRLKKYSYANQAITFLTDDLISSSSSPSWREWCETVTVEDQLIDNQNYTYVLEIEPLHSWANTLKVGSARIRYR